MDLCITSGANARADYSGSELFVNRPESVHQKHADIQHVLLLEGT